MQVEGQPQVQTLERRKEPRKRVLMHAFVSDREDIVDLKCMIRDISKGGCRIASSYIQDLPRIIDILPEGFDKPLTGRIVWRNSKMAGVQFLSAAESEEFDRDKPARKPERQTSGFFSKLMSLAGLHRRAGLVTRERSGMRVGLPHFSLRALHGVRQPLTAIKGLVGLLLGDTIRPIPKRAKTILRAVHRNAERAENLCEEALQADRIESGILPCNRVPVEIVDLVSKVAVVNTGFAATYDVRFEIRDKVGEAKVKADPARLEEVVTNLLSIAARFSPVGEMVTLSISRNGGSIRVAVGDKGTGSKVWHGDAGGKNGGADREEKERLGLDIWRAILKQHGTSLQVDSQPGLGTMVWFELPELS